MSDFAELSTDRRRSPRTMVRLAVQIGAEDAGGEPATLHDLSAEGFRMEADASFARGDAMWLRLPGQMPVQATIVWCNERMFGVAFKEALEASILRRALDAGSIAAPADEQWDGERSPALRDLLKRMRQPA
ncbi:PilZ domain-containing protein [Sphingomonas sp. 1P06PA]|uniref:PilZ domain-containing protein n=1 Tax=Sphingomonas sp. 1P06PA TaxID=554121 RepID=UPI0039A69009